MDSVTIKGREYAIISRECISNYPNIAALMPDVSYIATAIGKRGKLIQFYVTKSNYIILI